MLMFRQGFLSALFVVVGLLCVRTTEAQPPVTFELPLTPVSYLRTIYITFYYPKFNQSTMVYLSNNLTKCDPATYPSGFPTSKPLGLVGSVITWTPHDPKTYLRAPFTLSGEPNAQKLIYVCYSINGGRNWRQSADSKGLPYFKLWKDYPTATINPSTPLVGEMLYIYAKNVPKRSKAVLVRDPARCRGPQPEDSGSLNATLTGESMTFSIRPLTAGPYWLCLGSPPTFSVWNIIPIDQNSVLTFGKPPRSTDVQPYNGFNFTVYQAAAIVKSIKCSPLIAGARALCLIDLNATAVNAADLSFASITDGAGFEECPPPAIRPYQQPQNPRYAFEWIPQRSGRSGRFMLMYKGQPLLIRPDLDVPGRPFMTFTVQQEFSFLENYNYQNLFNLDYMTPKTNFLFANGLPTPWGGRQNGTRDGEMRTATLNLAKATKTDTLLQTVNLPAGATSCKVTVHYYFDGTLVDPFGAQNIGSMKVVAVTSGGTDISTLVNYQLYSSLRRVTVSGAAKSNIIDGDVKTMEQLNKQFNILPNYGKIRLELMVTRQTASLLYWVQPELKCVTTTPYINPRDFDGLKSIYTTLKGSAASSTLTNWETTKGSGIWNGDPCTQQWVGVTCRHFRVVGLNLARRGLVGPFPDLSRLPRLEQLNLAGNNIFGTIPASLANNTRLRSVNISFNAVGGIGSTWVFSGARQMCLHTLRLDNNKFTKFPRQVLSLPILRELDMSNNLMADFVPDLSKTVTNIEKLSLRNNMLKGPLPLLKSASMRSLDLSGNQFNGTIPAQWKTLQQIQMLDVSYNNIGGEIPKDLSLIRSAEGMVLRSVGNKHTGLIPRLSFDAVDVRSNVFRCPLPLNYDWTDTVVGLRMNYFRCDFLDPKAGNTL